MLITVIKIMLVMNDDDLNDFENDYDDDDYDDDVDDNDVNDDDDNNDDDNKKTSLIIPIETSSGSLQSPLATSSYEGGGRGGAVPQGALKSASRDIRSSSRVL